MTDEEADLPPRPEELDALPKPRLERSNKDALWSRIESTALLIPLIAPGAPPPPGPPPATSAAPAAGSAHIVAAAGKVIPVKVAAGLGVGLLATGLAGGAVVERVVYRPQPVVVERVVTQTKEVRVEVPVPTPAPPPPVEPAPAKNTNRKSPAPAQGMDLERQGLERVRTALMKHDPAAALAGLERLQQEVPRGHLLEERDSLRIQALQQAGRDADARAAARAFLKRYPNSVFGSAAEAVLKSESGK